VADDAREKLAAALCEQQNGPDGWDHVPGRRYWLEEADALLAPGGVVDEIAGKRAAEAEAKVERVEALAKVFTTAPGQGPIAAALIYGALAGGDEQAFAEYERQALDANPTPEPVAHNHTRFRNDAGPWSPCPVSCPAAELLR
jgi:hypothetical protein